ncbi:MAG: hypothetical protein EAZ84_11010 [Verrucomicrobia bacterium]|nr:MAG: hypothetical protein EAZ84_11010 [Verrucomicrobiota bacterium]
MRHHDYLVFSGGRDAHPTYFDVLEAIPRTSIHDPAARLRLADHDVIAIPRTTSFSGLKALDFHRAGPVHADRPRDSGLFVLPRANAVFRLFTIRLAAEFGLRVMEIETSG